MFIPDELKVLPRWCLADPKTKIPYSAVDGVRIKQSEDDKLITIYNLSESQKQEIQCGQIALGFCLHSSLNISVIDIDGKHASKQPERYSKLIQTFNSYTEVSQSGTGCHIWVKGNIGGGRRFNGLEVYSDGRYILMTGNHIPAYGDALVDRQEMLDELISTAPKHAYAMDAQDIEVASILTNQEVLHKCSTRSNGEKFNRLYNGDWQGLGYPSQSEADHALIEMLCFTTESNSQVRRLFKESRLYRPKHDARPDLATRSILSSRARAAQQANIVRFELPKLNGHPIDPYKEHAINQEYKKSQPKPAPEPLAWPPGFWGYLAQEFYLRSPSPIREVSIASAFGMLSGIVGKSFSINGLGLNSYVLMLAKSGVGKEALFSNPEKLFVQMGKEHTRYSIGSFLDFSNYASPEALEKAMRSSMCFAHFSREFGEAFGEMCSPRISPQYRKWRQLLTSRYSAGAPNAILGDMKYSQSENSIEGMNRGCAYTLVGDAPLTSFYRTMTDSVLVSGLISRFTTFHYRGEGSQDSIIRDNHFTPFTANLTDHIQSIVDLCSELNALGLRGENRVINISAEASDVINEYYRHIKGLTNGVQHEEKLQKYVRQVEKALKMAGVNACTDNPTNPIVTLEHINYAITHANLTMHEFEELEDEGGVGSEDVGLPVIAEIIYKKVCQKLDENGEITLTEIGRNLRSQNPFKKRGYERALDDGLKYLIEHEYLEIILKESKNGAAKPFTKVFKVIKDF
jgi:hypothetical protein